jgi:hypothetical protein
MPPAPEVADIGAGCVGVGSGQVPECGRVAVVEEEPVLVEDGLRAETTGPHSIHSQQNSA